MVKEQQMRAIPSNIQYLTPSPRKAPENSLRGLRGRKRAEQQGGDKSRTQDSRSDPHMSPIADGVMVVSGVSHFARSEQYELYSYRADKRCEKAGK